MQQRKIRTKKDLIIKVIPSHYAHAKVIEQVYICSQSKVETTPNMQLSMATDSAISQEIPRENKKTLTKTVR